MVDSFITSLGSEIQSDLPSASANGSSSLFHRRIEFHPARKPFKGFSNGGGDFRLETLNPGASSDQLRSGSNPAQSGLAGKKGDGSEFSESGLDPELSFSITVRRIVSVFVCCDWFALVSAGFGRFIYLRFGFYLFFVF